MTVPKAHCFVETGERRPPANEWAIDGIARVCRYWRPGTATLDLPILRRLPDDWLEQAWLQFLSLRKVRTVTKEQFYRCILGPDPEPEPERWEREAAIAWHLNNPGPELDSIGLARHFAKHRRQHEERRTSA